jgi:protein TonB
MDQKTEDKKNKAAGIAISVGIHALLLVLFFFMIAWRQPDPPMPGLPGMEINLGFVDAGSGNEQTSMEQVTEEKPTEEVQEEVPEEAIVSEEKIVTSNVESPYEVKEVEKAKEVKKEPVKKTEQVEAKNVFPNKNSSSDGDKENKKGDQGRPEGNPDSRNMFPGGNGNEKGPGNGGGGGTGGASMELPGWEWDTKPNKVDPTSESGYVLFEFFVDEEGTVMSVKKIGGANLTPSEDNFYKKQLLETSFHLKDSRANAAARTRGVFRFEVRSR